VAGAGGHVLDGGVAERGFIDVLVGLIGILV
jgi:hypothetical protein